MTEIKLGSRRKLNHDYQYVREIKNHLNSIVNPEGRENMVDFSKSVADPWPHQCRYYKDQREAPPSEQRLRHPIPLDQG